MILFLRGLFVVVLVAMLAVTTWASFQCPLFAVPREVFTHPWFIATLFDAYWGFVTFCVWVAYRETAWSSRGAWFVAVLLLGNIAMSLYCLRALRRAQAGDKLGPVLSSRESGVSGLGVGLAIAGIAVTLLALPRGS